MVFSLIRDVLPHARHLRSADAAREVSLLPLEPNSRVFIHPTRRVCFQHLHGLGNRDCWPQIAESVNIGVDSANANGVHAVRFAVLKTMWTRLLTYELDICAVPEGSRDFSTPFSRHCRAGLQVVSSFGLKPRKLVTNHGRTEDTENFIPVFLRVLRASLVRLAWL